MSEPNYLKCPCQKCGEPIEFPAPGLGMGVNCPHCNERTTLFAPEVVVETTRPGTAAPPTPPTDEVLTESEPAPKAGVPWMGIGLVLLALAGGIGAWLHFKKTPASDPARAAANPVKADATNVLSGTASNTPASPPTPSVPKSTNDLKVGPITLEKAKSGSLVYAVGVLKNVSDHKRYGVKIELELSDAKGNRAGQASDYKQVIEPREDWRFRALILDSKAVSARLSSITEDE